MRIRTSSGGAPGRRYHVRISLRGRITLVRGRWEVRVDAGPVRGWTIPVDRGGLGSALKVLVMGRGRTLRRRCVAAFARLVRDGGPNDSGLGIGHLRRTLALVRL